MLVPFCSACNQRCSPPAQSRRLENLGLFVGGANIGLDIIPLTGGAFSADTHICDDCMGKLLLAALGETSPLLDSKLKSLDIREAQVTAADVALRAERLRLADSLKEIEKKKKEIIELSVTDAVKERDERIKILEAQVRVLHSQKDQIWKKAQAQAAQFVEDSKNYPDYVEAVSNRETKRERG